MRKPLKNPANNVLSNKAKPAQLNMLNHRFHRFSSLRVKDRSSHYCNKSKQMMAVLFVTVSFAVFTGHTCTPVSRTVK